MPDRRITDLIAGGRWQEAGRLLEALGRTREAMDAYRNAGRQKDVERLRAGLLRSRPGSPGAPLFRARAHAERGQTKQALSVLMTLRPVGAQYKAACRMAIRIAEQSDLLDFDLDHFLAPFLAGEGGLGHEPADLPSLDQMGDLYARQGLDEAAGSAWRAILTLTPGWGDVQGKLDALARAGGAGKASFEDLLESEVAFRHDRTAGSEPSPRAALPPLPDLPSLDSLEAMAKGEEPPMPPRRTPERHTTKQHAVPDVLKMRRVEKPPGPTPGEDATITLDELPARPERPVDPSLLAVGDLVAERYEVQGMLGQGGMGMVLHVTDTMLGEDVAMKLIHRDGGVRDEDRERFKSEMRICRRLQHPSVVRVFEFGMWRGSLFLTMELMRGTDLHAVLKEAGGPLPVVLALRLLIQACDGLGAAHKLGVVHRDVKPQNLFVLAGGEVLKVMDFGIAQPGTVDRNLTATGAIVGSPAYLAPERLRGEPAIPASDFYALGCVAYQMLTGAHPFRATEMAALFVQHLQVAPVPPSRLNPAVPDEVERLVLKLLAKEPERRYNAANPLRRALTSAWRSVLDPAQ